MQFEPSWSKKASYDLQCCHVIFISMSMQNNFFMKKNYFSKNKYSLRPKTIVQEWKFYPYELTIAIKQYFISMRLSVCNKASHFFKNNYYLSFVWSRFTLKNFKLENLELVFSPDFGYNITLVLRIMQVTSKWTFLSVFINKK